MLLFHEGAGQLEKAAFQLHFKLGYKRCAICCFFDLVMFINLNCLSMIIFARLMLLLFLRATEIESFQKLEKKYVNCTCRLKAWGCILHVRNVVKISSPVHADTF